MNSLNKIFGLFLGFTVFPYLILFGFNFGFFIFLFFFIVTKKKLALNNYKSYVKIIIALYSIGVIISSLYNFEITDVFSKIINYIYWILIINVLIKSRHHITLSLALKYASPFYLILIVYSFLRDFAPKDFFLLNYISSNTVAFLFVCFTVPFFVYFKDIKKRFYFSYVILFLVLISLLFDGRRAGFGLVFLSVFFVLNFKKINFVSIFKFGVVSLILIFILNLNFVSSSIKSSSDRIYNLIYNTKEINEDRSYQTRLAMIEKGLIMFEENPIVGVGATNFGKTDVVFKGRFANTDVVTNKFTINETSAHNSYLQLLSEMGLITFIPFLLIILYNVSTYIYFSKTLNNIQSAFYFSFFACCIHLYFISALFNVYAWVLIGIVTSQSVLIRENSKK